VSPIGQNYRLWTLNLPTDRHAIGSPGTKYRSRNEIEWRLVAEGLLSPLDSTRLATASNAWVDLTSGMSRRVSFLQLKRWSTTSPLKDLELSRKSRTGDRHLVPPCFEGETTRPDYAERMAGAGPGSLYGVSL
jgi:hypothetical protein